LLFFALTIGTIGKKLLEKENTERYIDSGNDWVVRKTLIVDVSGELLDCLQIPSYHNQCSPLKCPQHSRGAMGFVN
jgi:hypothetical protein